MSTAAASSREKNDCSKALRDSYLKLIESATGISNLIEQQKIIEEQVEHQESMINALSVENSRLKDENEAAKKFLISNLPENLSQEHGIEIKLFGEIDITPFINVCSKRQSEKLSNEATITKATEICSHWQHKFKDPAWSPFKKVNEGGTEKEIVNESDGELKKLKKEMGISVFKAVTRALQEVNEHNPIGRYPVSKLWNAYEIREATIQEIFECSLKDAPTPKRQKAVASFDSASRGQSSNHMKGLFQSLWEIDNWESVTETKAIAK